MKITCKRENLLKGLNIVSRMVKQRATLPVLGNILLSSDKGRLKLSVTDLEAAVVTWVGAKIDEEGAITLPARTLLDYVSTSSDELISLSAQNSDVAIKSDRNRATIKGILAEEFPIIPAVESSEKVSVEASALKTAIFSTSICAAPDETRPVLSGILFRVKDGKMLVVATDSYRLAQRSIESSSLPKTFADIIIPQRVASELARILPDDDSAVEISVADNQAQFVCGEVVFISRLIEGSFPDYEQIVPTDFIYQFEADKSEIVEAIKLANVFARDIGGNIKLIGEQNRVEIVSVSSQTGDTATSLEVSSSGKPLTVAFNARYIMDALNVINGSRITFAFAGELNPGQITDNSDQNFKYIIMPLRGE
ncbi:MAG: DNA polymerase III subunit beta [candidate division WS2 bacterium ADurb.Bin280]|uniref:Beta sliding clamp n=1 Tax=candidate division WS2 bacterium ADurb.Bin280 TaxID=1852829 RepID=A0A1V5SF80_9BACT|nr:MAG: DNA polymerase III subunit beta [candidate division WS2 bacterium ADurb.Bin280]